MRTTLDSPRRRIGLLSTYPPKLCGLATFAASLEREIRAQACRVDVVRIVDGDDLASIGSSVVAELVNGDSASVRATARALSRCDVAIIQHEYGIYGGEDGDEVIDVLSALEVPAIVTLHTVPLVPSPHQRSVLESVCELAARVVVMSAAASDRLLELYHVDPSKVETIAHGATTAAAPPVGADDARLDLRPQLLTWGLIGPGKGIEHAIDALALLDDLRPAARYTIAGVTHPKVFAAHGDRYRSSLVARAHAAGLERSVTFDDTYRDRLGLARFVASASVVVLPYDSRDQVTSGVLVDAIAAGRPVIATAFPHAVELLGSGAGIVVPQGDPVALADAIRTVLSDPVLLGSMAAEARRIAPSLSWSAVAAQYVQLAEQLADAATSVAM